MTAHLQLLPPGLVYVLRLYDGGSYDARSPYVGLGVIAATGPLATQHGFLMTSAFTRSSADAIKDALRGIGVHHLTAERHRLKRMLDL